MDFLLFKSTRLNLALRCIWKACVVCGFITQSVFAESETDVLALQKIVVEATRINRHPWRYVTVPGYEILSQCDDAQTEAVARHIANSLELDQRLIPKGFWGDMTSPLTLILFDFQPTKALAPFVPTPLRSRNGSDFGSVLLPGSRAGNDLIVNLGRGDEMDGGIDAGDFDTVCVVQNRWHARWEWSGGTSGRGPIPLGLLSRLDHAVPPVPAWFKYAMVGPSRLLRMLPVSDVNAGAFRGVVVAGAKWLTDADNSALLSAYNNSRKLPTLPPVGDLFRPDHATHPSAPAAWPSPEYMAEASLFVRWGMTPISEAGRNGTRASARERSVDAAHRKAFAKFVDRARAEPVTESVLRECFGLGYAEMRSVLSEYLVTAAQNTFALNRAAVQGWSPDDAVTPMRAATAAEIGRITGDWLRMQADSFPPTRSEERDVYLNAARRVLERAFRDDNGLSPSVPLLPPKDPQPDVRPDASVDSQSLPQPVTISASKIHDTHLLAVFGLYYYDLGDAISARELLEAATEAGTPRPAAYLALAHLRRDAAFIGSDKRDGKFSANQVAAILTPLFSVINRWNLDVSGYRLIADTWSHSAVKPSSANLQVLESGLRRYPFDSSLLFATAQLYAKWGYLKEANQTVVRSFRFADPATIEKLRSAQSTWAAEK